VLGNHFFKLKHAYITEIKARFFIGRKRFTSALDVSPFRHEFAHSEPAYFWQLWKPSNIASDHRFFSNTINPATCQLQACDSVDFTRQLEVNHIDCHQ
jgi:hypothetical protein